MRGLARAGPGQTPAGQVGQTSQVGHGETRRNTQRGTQRSTQRSTKREPRRGGQRTGNRNGERNRETNRATPRSTRRQSTRNGKREDRRNGGEGPPGPSLLSYSRLGPAPASAVRGPGLAAGVVHLAARGEGRFGQPPRTVLAAMIRQTPAAQGAVRRRSFSGKPPGRQAPMPGTLRPVPACFRLDLWHSLRGGEPRTCRLATCSDQDRAAGAPAGRGP